MCPLPDHGRVIAMDRPDDVGVPALEATHCQWPQGATGHSRPTSTHWRCGYGSVLVYHNVIWGLGIRDKRQRSWSSNALVQLRAILEAYSTQ
jgi:hypothetical protein